MHARLPTEAATRDRLAVDIAEKGFATAQGGRTPVLEGLSFTLERGRFTCLVGPSGCGKTTTLRILLGLEPDYVGSIDPAFARERVAAVFQEPRLLPWRTLEENVRLALPAELAGKDLAPLLDKVGLSEFRNAYPAELSLGMARRAALVRAFAIEPEILILDEPFVSLDEPTANRLRAALADLLAATPVTGLMVTHNLREAVALADRILVLTDRPARLADDVEIDRSAGKRTGSEADAFIRGLAERFPGLVGL